MTIDEFHAILQVTIDDFTARWRVMHEVKPEEWPLTLSGRNMWFEQFIQYIADLEDSLISTPD